MSEDDDMPVFASPVTLLCCSLVGATIWAGLFMLVMLWLK